jgi:hypothetical protein
MSQFKQSLAQEINNLDSILYSLRLIQDAFEQAKERYNVDDYYDILVSLAKAKEISRTQTHDYRTAVVSNGSFSIKVEKRKIWNSRAIH